MLSHGARGLPLVLSVKTPRHPSLGHDFVLIDKTTLCQYSDSRRETKKKSLLRTSASWMWALFLSFPLFEGMIQATQRQFLDRRQYFDKNENAYSDNPLFGIDTVCRMYVLVLIVFFVLQAFPSHEKIVLNQTYRSRYNNYCLWRHVLLLA